MTLTHLSACELHNLFTAGELSAEAIAEACLEAIRQGDERIHAFLSVDESDVLAQAQAIDRKRRSGLTLGRLAGVPVAVKDGICTRLQRTTAGSRMLANFLPPYDATVIARLRAADAIILGKTNMDEFAMGSSTENSAWGVTANPWDVSRTAGGSSGGSAAAVAAGFCPVALGSDTGGSIRQPAALCGIVGLKPSYGLVSRFGLIAYASSLDQIGPMGRTVSDVASLLETIAGHDVRDSTSVKRSAVEYTKTLEQPLDGLRIGLPREFFGEGLDAEVEQAVRKAIEVYRQLGARIVDISLPHSRLALAVYYIVAPAEASSNLARYDGMHYGHRTSAAADLVGTYAKSRGEVFGKEVKRRILIGTYVLSSGYIDAYYLQALKVRRLVKRDFDEAFQQCDLILGPTTPTPAFLLGEKENDPLAMYLSDVYTVSANLAGIPGLSLCCGFTQSGLPIGLQLLAPHFEEERLLRAAGMYERATDWHSRRPPQ